MEGKPRSHGDGTNGEVKKLAGRRSKSSPCRNVLNVIITVKTRPTVSVFFVHEEPVAWLLPLHLSSMFNTNPGEGLAGTLWRSFLLVIDIRIARNGRKICQAKVMIYDMGMCTGIRKWCDRSWELASSNFHQIDLVKTSRFTVNVMDDFVRKVDQQYKEPAGSWLIMGVHLCLNELSPTCQAASNTTLNMGKAWDIERKGEATNVVHTSTAFTH
ncbi:hypothetical protein B0H34DRAFT_843660 [Crassisporium funariophilum]|nr:hypothetical protein B0H34DRAFT_843660 [Crassisporium funariophilum]